MRGGTLPLRRAAAFVVRAPVGLAFEDLVGGVRLAVPWALFLARVREAEEAAR